MSFHPIQARAAAFALVLCGTGLLAQMPNPYGPPISLEQARKPAAVALAEAAKNKWNMAVAIVDPSGTLVYFERMDGTQTGSIQVAQNKARCAARFKRPTKAFQDGLAAGGVGLRILDLEGVVAVDSLIVVRQAGASH